LVVQSRFTAKSPMLVVAVTVLEMAETRFPGVGKNVPRCACWKHMSFVSHFVRAGDADDHRGQPFEGGFEVIEKVFAAVGLGGASQPQPARRGMLSQDMFESPSLKDGQSRRSSQANGHGPVTPPPSPEAKRRRRQRVERPRPRTYRILSLVWS
jgi:hypothetical protein